MLFHCWLDQDLTGRAQGLLDAAGLPALDLGMPWHFIQWYATHHLLLFPSLSCRQRR